MAITITTATGRVIPCESIVLGRAYPVLHIHTKALTGADAYTIFSDPGETATLEETVDVVLVEPDENGEEREIDAQRHRRFTGFTRLYSVGPSPLVDDSLLIWLNRPAVDADEEETQ